MYFGEVGARESDHLGWVEGSQAKVGVVADAGEASEMSKNDGVFPA